MTPIWGTTISMSRKIHQHHSL